MTTDLQKQIRDLQKELAEVQKEKALLLSAINPNDLPKI